MTKRKINLRNFLKVIVIAICFIGGTKVMAQSTGQHIDSMIYDLQKANWGAVRMAKDSIENFQKEAIPKLIELLKDTSYVKLKNTCDLIYPGAEEFYGHGGIVNYDIDWIAVRAAWVLEEITFQNFGYLDLTITRLMLADKVLKWWDENKNTWTKFEAIKEALSCTDEERQVNVLHYLRFGKSKCDGLTLENYKNEILPLVEKIIQRNDSDRASLQAKHLLDDKEFYWLKIKNENGSK